MPYDPTTPRVAQDDSWSCSCATTSWVLQSVGVYAPYHGVEQDMLAAGLVTTQKGLLMGNGKPLASWVEEHYAVPTGVRTNPAPLSWDWLMSYAGSKPIAIGSSTWYHWSGVRDVSVDGNLLLANPADGWKGVSQEMSPQQFANLGPFTAWWIEVEEAEDMGQIEELVTRLSYIQHEAADALQSALDSARRARKDETRKEALDAAQAALNSIRDT